MQIIRKKYNWASPLFKRNKTNRIILHHAQAKTCSVEDIHQWHLKKGWSGINWISFFSKKRWYDLSR